MAGAVGRPRKNSQRRQGVTAREEILDAAAELFTTRGFATTSTHQIANAVGIRQASLYYHFPSKTEIFLTLLKQTTEPSVALVEKLNSELPATTKLWALVAAEARLLLSTPWNVGRLYQLPIAASEEFDEYHRQRAHLQGTFVALAEEIVGAGDPRAELPFHIAMSVIEIRPNDGRTPSPLSATELPDTAVMLADAALDILHATLPEDRSARALELLDDTDVTAVTSA